MQTNLEFLQENWEMFAEWRATLRIGDLRTAKAMGRLDQLIAECVQRGILGDEEKMREYLELYTPFSQVIKQKIHAINNTVQYFRDHFKEIKFQLGYGAGKSSPQELNR